MLGSRQLVLFAVLLCVGLAGPARAEDYLTTGILINLKPGQLTLDRAGGGGRHRVLGR